MARELEHIDYILKRISQNDDEKALKTLFDHYFGKLVETAKFFVNDHSAAQEIVSNVFIKIWNNRSNLETIKNFNSYLFTAIKRQSLNYLRDNKNKLHQSLDENESIIVVELNSPEKVLLSKEFVGILNRAVQELPSKCRLVYSLVKDDGLKYQEVADMLNISIKTVEMHIGKALKRIKIAIGKY